MIQLNKICNIIVKDLTREWEFMSKDSSTKSTSNFKPFWLITSMIILITILLLPTPESLPLMAKSALAILLFAVILWVTEAVTYPVSAVMIVGLIILLIGFSPVQNLSESLGYPQSNGKILKGDSLLEQVML